MSGAVSHEVVIVTGAASGIGEACAKALAADGRKVCAVDINPVDMEALGKPGNNIISVRADVSDPNDCQRIVQETAERFGKVNGLIHMAAAHSTETTGELTADIFNRILRVNVTGSFLISRAVADQLATSGGGAIVLASSGVVLSGGVGGQGRGGPAYTASKAAIHGLTRSLAKTYGAAGIRVNSVAPGSTETAMTAEYDDAARAGVAARTLVGRMGQPHEIAAAAIFLVSDAAGYITGENINVNGGGSFGL